MASHRLRTSTVAVSLLAALVSSGAIAAGCGGGEVPIDVDGGTGFDAGSTPGDAGARDAGPRDTGPACEGTMCGEDCVDLETDPRHCGTCDTDCAALPHVDGSSVTCEAGACVLDGACEPGFAHCGDDPTAGCETDLSTITDCGACGVACAEPTPLCAAAPDGTAACASGCEGATPTRCDSTCVDITGDPRHCGDCATECASPANGAATCVDSACGVACDAGFHACGATCEPDDSVLACGASCETCAVPPNATATCDGTACGFVCNEGFDDCDADPANGCEAELAVDLDHCGACATACAAPGGIPACTGGTCGIATCDPGRADCNGDLSDGCEVDVTGDVAHCGTCDAVCSSNNGLPACVAGSCEIACDPGYDDCDGASANGCETNLAADVSSCGACGAACSVPNGAPACLSGTCAVAGCNPPFADCDGVPGNGCERNLGNDVNSCGSCGRACSVANGTPGCAGGSCTILACNPGFADCNGLAADGCEVNTANNPGNCGGCGIVCTVANGVGGCSAGACRVAACNAGFGDCNGFSGDGCEVNLQTSSTSCGTCGNNCGASCAGNVTATTCAAGSCAIIGCAPGYFNVDGMCGGGCECRTSGTSAACAAPSSLGTLSIGQTTTYTGNLVPAGQEAYLSVSFVGNTNASYHPRVRFTAGAADFAFDILTNCSGSAMACGVEGGNSTNRTDWEVRYTAGDPGSPFFNPIPPVGSGGSVIIRVYRRPGRPVTCANYTLTISN